GAAVEPPLEVDEPEGDLFFDLPRRGCTNRYGRFQTPAMVGKQLRPLTAQRGPALHLDWQAANAPAQSGRDTQHRKQSGRACGPVRRRRHRMPDRQDGLAKLKPTAETLARVTC